MTAQANKKNYDQDDDQSENPKQKNFREEAGSSNTQQGGNFGQARRSGSSNYEKEESNTYGRGDTQNYGQKDTTSRSSQTNQGKEFDAEQKSTGMGTSSEDMYEVEEDKESKKWMVHPVSRGAGSGSQETDKWCVECNSRNDANAYRKELAEGKIKPPTDAPSKYRNPRRNAAGKMIYTKL